MELAKPGDPLVANDGSLIEPEHVSSMDVGEVIEKRKVMPAFSQLAPTKQLSIEKLPEPDMQQQTVICAVVGLRLLGLSDVDIAETMNTSLEQLQRIVKLPATQTTFEKAYQNIIHAKSESIQGRIAAHAGEAVDTVFSLMGDEDIRDDVRLKAAQDVLDRSGTHPDQFFSDVTKHDQNDDELRIVFMDEETGQEKVAVEIKKG